MAKGKPTVIVTPEGEKYQATVLHILARDEFGRPSEIHMLHDDESVELKGGEEFMIVYAPSHMLKKQS